MTMDTYTSREPAFQDIESGCDGENCGTVHEVP